MKTTYEVYSEWCRDHGHHIPTKEAFYEALTITRQWYLASGEKQRQDDLEIERGVRYDWGNLR